MKSFILMVQFLTRIPIPVELNVTTKDFERGPVYFPMVGFIIGALLSGLYALLQPHLSLFLLGICLVAAEVFITGGLHLDGLSDTFDGIYSNRDRERMLEIMKDSRLGANGALALLFFMLLKMGLIMELEPRWAVIVLFMMPLISRMNLVLACRYSEYAREDGMGNLFIGKVSRKMLIGALAFTGVVIVAALWGTVMGLSLWLGTSLFAFYYMKHVSDKIGGMTGDTLGALCELSEIVVLGLAVMSQILHWV